MKIKEIKENSIIFDNGYELEAYHERDCCEEVYSDFDILTTYNVSTITGKTINIKDIDFEETLNKLVKGIEGQGFNLISKIGENFFVPCYNEQNGYYSSNLTLILYKDKETLDITDFIKDRIY